MLDWTVRWGIPLAFLGLIVLLGDSRTLSPSSLAYEALDIFRSALTGMIPNFF